MPNRISTTEILVTNSVLKVHAFLIDCFFKNQLMSAILRFARKLLWDLLVCLSPALVGTIVCPVLWNLRTQDKTLDMPGTCPQNPPKSQTLSEKTPSIVLCFSKCMFLVCTVQKCTKEWKIIKVLDYCWCTGGCMHKGSIKTVFKCPNRTHCLHNLRTFFHVQDMSMTFPTKSPSWSLSTKMLRFTAFPIASGASGVIGSSTSSWNSFHSYIGEFIFYLFQDLLDPYII